LADILFGGADKALNQIVQLGSNNYRVIGVYKDPNETRNRLANMNNGNLLMANTQLAAEYNVAEIMNVVVHVKKLDDVLKDGSAAARLMTKLSGVREGEYQMFDQASQLAAIQSQVAIVQVVFG
ncbi:ABC transporter permease, partial [Streptococcus agalactiae]